MNCLTLTVIITLGPRMFLSLTVIITLGPRMFPLSILIFFNLIGSSLCSL